MDNCFYTRRDLERRFETMKDSPIWNLYFEKNDDMSIVCGRCHKPFVEHNDPEKLERYLRYLASRIQHALWAEKSDIKKNL